MNKLLSLLFVLCFAITSCFSQSDCNPYFVLKEGKSWTIKSYNKKDKYEGKQTSEILSVTQESGKYVAVIKVIAFDEKDKEILNKEITFECIDGVFNMDMTSLMPAETMESFKSMDMEMEIDQMTIPSELAIGQSLDDGSVTIKINGPVSMKIAMTVKNRKVESKETIQVPAGSFETFKITSNTEMSGIGKRQFMNVDYIAENIGFVRSEQYDNKGKLQSYSVLSSYTE